MFVFYKDDGKIIGGCSANSPQVELTYIPNGTKSLYIDDTEYADAIKNLGFYVIKDGKPVYTTPEVTVAALIPSDEEIEKAERQITLINDLTEIGVIV